MASDKLGKLEYVTRVLKSTVKYESGRELREKGEDSIVLTA